ncbi:putative membrane protein (plasmid) [Burkholderia pseudomallei]|nr:putative membrane protein [Burkholderia pseudomallei]KGC96417.1 putative membrane protein [Burkholderia pseudomallei]KGD55184.1 putative membrane protein [Burkholderia pseudomallei]KGW98328.1 putative membrane protein [Burkholderia pseudomallei MSHR456]
MMSKFDRIFETSMFISLAVLAIMANTQCPTWLRIAL